MRKNWFYFLFLLFPAMAISQNKKTLDDIDPRQFVMLYEDAKKPAPPVLIWKYDSVQRKVSKLNNESIIRVEFDRSKIAGASNFKGHFTLSAFLNDREIPILPYSTIGQEKIKIGFQNNSASQNGANFLNIISTATKIDSLWSMTRPVFDDRSGIYLSRQINELIIYYNRINPDAKMDISTGENANLFSKLSRVSAYVPESSTLAVYLENPELFTNNEILSELRDIKNTVDRQGTKAKIENQAKIKTYQKLLNLIRNFNQEYKAFYAAGERTVSSYLELINMNQKEMKRIHENLVSIAQNLSMVDTMQAKSVNKYEGQIRSDALKARTLVSQITDLKGTDFQQMINDTKANLNKLSADKKDVLIKKLTEKAAKDLFTELVYGTINLKDAKARSSEKLSIYINWYVNDNETNVSELHLGTFKIGNSLF